MRYIFDEGWGNGEQRISDIFHWDPDDSRGEHKSFTYCFLNMTPLNDKKTIEFRQHEATLDPLVVVRWVNEINHFIQRSLNTTEAEFKKWADDGGMPKDILHEFWPRLKDIESSAENISGQDGEPSEQDGEPPERAKEPSERSESPLQFELEDVHI
jgi:hypothetical protein